MNNQEAAEMIRNDMKLHHDSLSGEYRKALSMAISALQAQEEKTQLSAEGTTFDLISRQAAIDYCYALINAENPSDPSDEWNYSQERINQTEVILHHLEFMPSAQLESEERKAESAQNVPKEDLISRKATIEAMGKAQWAKERLMELPSAQPEPCKDAVSREAAIDVAENAFVRGLLASPDIRKLPSVQPEPQWIPVSERLPEPRVDVWVNSDIGQIQGYYEEHIGIWYASFGQGRDYLELIVTAWMPLPEPYRAERRTDE